MVHEVVEDPKGGSEGSEPPPYQTHRFFFITNLPKKFIQGQGCMLLNSQ